MIEDYCQGGKNMWQSTLKMNTGDLPFFKSAFIFLSSKRHQVPKNFSVNPHPELGLHKAPM